MAKDILISTPIYRKASYSGILENTATCSSDCGALWLAHQTIHDICAKKKCCKRFKKAGKKKCKNCPKRK